MKTNTINILKGALIVLLATTKLSAQERSNAYTNLLNPFLYNPSLAGNSDNIYAILNARSMVGGTDGMARSYNFGIHAPFTNNNGLGAKVLSTSVGVFQTTNVEGAYSKQVKFNGKHNLNFGLSIGFTQTNLKSELLNGQVDLTDKTISSKDLNTMLLSSGAGLFYKYGKQAELGIAFPALITGSTTLNSMMVVNAAWNFYRGTAKEWKIKPMVNYYNLNNSPAMSDMLLQGTWKEMISLTAGYRTNGSMIVAAGLNFKSIAINYAYYSHMGGLEALAPAQNEIALAFWFNKPKPAVTATKNEVVSEDVIQDEIDKLNERLNGLINVEKTNPGLVNMKKEMNKLNKDLGNVLGKYKITNNEQVQKIKTLQSTIESVIAKYND